MTGGQVSAQAGYNRQAPAAQLHPLLFSHTLLLRYVLVKQTRQQLCGTKKRCNLVQRQMKGPAATASTGTVTADVWAAATAAVSRDLKRGKPCNVWHLTVALHPAALRACLVPMAACIPTWTSRPLLLPKSTSWTQLLFQILLRPEPCSVFQTQPDISKVHAEVLRVAAAASQVHIDTMQHL
jgi:hypothetical protein